MSALESVIISGLLSRITPSEHYAQLLVALRLSCGFQLASDQLPQGAQDIATTAGLDIDTLLQEGVLLTKNRAVDFLRALGVLTSANLLKKKLFKQGRYQEKFHRTLFMFNNRNIYTYAELFFLTDRPAVWQTFLHHVNNTLSDENTSAA